MAQGKTVINAMIIPLSSASPPPRPTPGPTPPVEPPVEPPLGFWGPNDPRPSPPIYLPVPPGAPPLDIWGPSDPRPGTGLPEDQPYPDNTLPPETGGGWEPVYIWGPGDPRPGTGLPADQPVVTPPIYLPPDGEVPPEFEKKIEWKAAWTPTTGWIVVGVPKVPVPTPSKAKRR